MKYGWWQIPDQKLLPLPNVSVEVSSAHVVVFVKGVCENVRKNLTRLLFFAKFPIQQALGKGQRAFGILKEHQVDQSFQLKLACHTFSLFSEEELHEHTLLDRSGHGAYKSFCEPGDLQNQY